MRRSRSQGVILRHRRADRMLGTSFDKIGEAQQAARARPEHLEYTVVPIFGHFSFSYLGYGGACFPTSCCGKEQFRIMEWRLISILAKELSGAWCLESEGFVDVCLFAVQGRFRKQLRRASSRIPFQSGGETALQADTELKDVQALARSLLEFMVFLQLWHLFW